MRRQAFKRFLGILLFFAGFFGLFIAGWEIEYSGPVIERLDGRVVSAQRHARKWSRLARVRLAPGQTVSADCPDAVPGQHVRIDIIRGKIFENRLYRCDLFEEK